MVSNVPVANTSQCVRITMIVDNNRAFLRLFDEMSFIPELYFFNLRVFIKE